MSCRKIILRLTEIYILLFASIHLLSTGFSGYSHIFDAKKVTFCTINLLYLISVSITLFAFWDTKRDTIRAFLRRSLCPSRIFVVFYMLFTAISAVFSGHFPHTIFGISRFEGAFTICLYCICFLLISLFPVRKRYLLYVFTASVTAFAAICAVQLLGYNPLSLYPSGMNFYDAGVLYTTAFLGTTGNTNLTGAFISLTLPFLAVIFIRSKEKKRFLLLIPLTLLIFTALKMNVDSLILGLAAALAVTLPIILNFGKKGLAVYFASILILALLFITFIYFNPPDTGFLWEIHEILHGRIDEGFGSGRIRIWKNVLSEISDSPVFGKGPDTMQEENFPAFERFYPALGKIKRTGIDVAHNEFLNILYHQGFLGLLCYLGFVFSVLRLWLKSRQNTLILALGCAIICYLVQSLFTFSMCITAPYFWIAAGLIVGLSEENI